MPLFSTQHPLVLAFGILGNIISIFVYLAPVPTFYHIYKKKSTESFQSLPYQVSMFSSMLWLYYALLKGSDTFLLITINSFGCIVETIYISLFFAYATKKVRISAMKLFVSLNIALVAIIILCIHFLIKDSDRVKVLGWTNVFISVIVFAAPLSIVRKVIKTKSVEFMPFTLSFFLTLSAIMWFGYGLFNKDMCIALPNVIGFVLGMLQMLLYAIYKNAKNGKENENMPTEQLRSIVIMKSLSTSEVHPLDVRGEAVGNKDKQEVKKEEKAEKKKQDSNECPV